MPKYIKETIKILSVSMGLALFPHLVLAKPASFSQIIDKKIQTMTLDEKVGQLFMVGFSQKTITPELQNFLSTYKPGSFLLFKRNIQSADQIRALNTELYKASYKISKLPPLIAIDQEGGAVSRLPIIPAQPNALAIGQTQSPLLAEEMGFQTGRFLREVGFNMNLAPVLDVSDPYSGSFIGVRSFGSDPAIVASLGVAYSKGLMKARVIPTAKHFPGTGDLQADPHLKVVENKSSLKSLQEKDLKPYESYAKLGAHVAVMLSHYIYPSLDETKEPASFSKKIVQNLLRTELGYKGLVITDDLQMQGSKQILRPEIAALKTLQAGADIVMLTYSFTDQQKAIQHVKAAVQSGEFPISDIDQKLRRILNAKAFANVYRRKGDEPSLLQGPSLTSMAYMNIEASILEKNLEMSLLTKTLPTKSSSRKRAPASVGNLCLLAPVKKFISSFTASSARKAKTRLLKGTSQDNDTAKWLVDQKCDQALIAVTGPKTAALVASLPRSYYNRVVIINLGSPRLFPKRNLAPRVVDLYFNHEESGRKVALHLEEILSSTQSYALR